jgi:glycerol uptake facilitator-like aquaporin
MKQYGAEFLGTFWLVLGWCLAGAAVPYLRPLFQMSVLVYTGFLWHSV